MPSRGRGTGRRTGRTRRGWRKLHIGVDADTGRIAAALLTAHDEDDAAQVGPLLNQVGNPVASLTADGAYDQAGAYIEVAARHPDAAVVNPPRVNAVPSDMAETTPTQRDRHLDNIARHGRMGWQTRSGYNFRALVEADIGRFKRVIGDGLRTVAHRREAGNRGGDRRRCAEPDARAWTTRIRPHHLIEVPTSGQRR